MSRATARAGIVDWLTGLPGVATVYGTAPQVIPAQKWATLAGAASSTIVVVKIATEDEKRIAIGGPTSGWKRLDYTIELNLYHRSTCGDTDRAKADFDDCVDTIRDRLREDRTMGGVFWQQGETQLRVDNGDPRVVGSVIEAWSRITFGATEMVQT